MLKILNNKIILSPSKTFLKYDSFWGVYMDSPLKAFSYFNVLLY